MAGVVVEDGTVVTGANSFVTAAFVLAYLTDRNVGTVWDSADGDVQNAAVLRAADYLKNEQRFDYRGSKLTYLQSMPWPRQGASERRGPVIPSNAVPWRMQHAQAELAGRFLSGTDLQPDLERGGKVKTETVDVITTTYMDDAPGETLLQSVMGILNPLLRRQREDVLPYHAAPAVLTPFASDDFSNKR